MGNDKPHTGENGAEHKIIARETSLFNCKGVTDVSKTNNHNNDDSNAKAEDEKQ